MNVVKASHQAWLVYGRSKRNQQKTMTQTVGTTSSLSRANVLIYVLSPKQEAKA